MRQICDGSGFLDLELVRWCVCAWRTQLRAFLCRRSLFYVYVLCAVYICNTLCTACCTENSNKDATQLVATCFSFPKPFWKLRGPLRQQGSSRALYFSKEVFPCRWIHFISDCWYQCVVDHHLPQEGWMECVRHNGEGHLIPGTTLPPPTVLCCRVTVLEGAICILSHLSNHFLTSLEIPEPNHDYVNEGFGLIQGFGLFTLPLAGSGNFTRNLLFFRSWTSSWCHHE